MNTSVLRLAEDTFVVPAWFPQQKTWLEDPRHSDNAIFNYPLLVRLRGPLNEQILKNPVRDLFAHLEERTRGDQSPNETPMARAV